VRDQYRQAVDYALRVVFDYAARHAADPPLIFVVGDHQAAGFVALDDRPDVPVHVIGPEALVDPPPGLGLDRGYDPRRRVEVLSMARMRDLILDAYSRPSPNRGRQLRLLGIHIPGWAVRLAQVAIALGLLALIWRAADGPEAARSLAAADWRWLALAFVVLSVQTVLSALRWQLTARQLGIALGTAGDAGILLVPGREPVAAGRHDRGRGPRRAVPWPGRPCWRRAGRRVRTSGRTDRTVRDTWRGLRRDACGSGRPGLAPMAHRARPCILAMGISVPVLALAAVHLPGAVGRAACKFRNAFVRALAARPALPGQIALSLGTTICNLAAFAFCARAVGVDLSLAAVAALVPLILFTMLIPISVSGWGLREGAAATLLPVAGATASGGLAASVAFGLVFAASVLPGFLLLWLRGRAETAANRGSCTPH
jgi:uncharacterized membrane protein YbhN (UPF0104 family)